MWKYRLLGLNYNLELFWRHYEVIMKKFNVFKYFYMKTLTIVSFNHMITVNTTFFRFLYVKISIFGVKFLFSVILTSLWRQYDVSMTSVWRHYDVILTCFKYFWMKTIKIVSFNHMLTAKTTFSIFLDVKISIFLVKF